MKNVKDYIRAPIGALMGIVAATVAILNGLELSSVFQPLSNVGPETGLFAMAVAGSTEDVVKELKSNLEQILGEDGLESDISEAKDAAHEAKRKVEEMSDRNAELVDELKSVKEEKNALQKQADQLEVKLKEGFGPSSGRGRTDIGEEVVSALKERHLRGSPGRGFNLNTKFDSAGVKDITNVGASAGDAVFPTEREEIIPKPQLRTPTVLDLITILETEKDAVEYLEQDSETDAAAPQSGQGSTLSQSDMGVTKQTVTIETIGHVAKASVQILDDAPRLRTFVNTRMRQLLELELEDQVLTGDGTGNNLDGILPNATAYDSNLETVVDGTTTDIDRIGVMILQVQRNNFPPTAVLLSPLNWWGIQLQKDANDEYQFVNPQGQTSPRLWGLPVASTNAMPEGEAAVGNMEVGVTFYDRMDTALELATENATDFEDLLVTIRAYLRGGVVVDQSKAVVHNANMDATAPSSGS